MVISQYFDCKMPEMNTLRGNKRLDSRKPMKIKDLTVCMRKKISFSLIRRFQFSILRSWGD